MIVMKSVRGPAIYDYSAGYDITVGEVEEIQQSSGSMCFVGAATSSQFTFLQSGVSGNIITVKAHDTKSGLLVATTSADFSLVHLFVLADGY